MNGFLLFVHLVAVIVWVGGMFFMTQCLHPTLVGLPGPDRLKVVVPTLERFLRWVLLAIVLIWVSGLAMIALRWPIRMPAGWHLMILAAVVMSALFGVIRGRLFGGVKAALARGEPAMAAPLLARIRQLVLINLALGIVAVAGMTLLV